VVLLEALVVTQAKNLRRWVIPRCASRDDLVEQMGVRQRWRSLSLAARTIRQIAVGLELACLAAAYVSTRVGAQ
jgi:hypothetical protein